jgi:hypothetical protein
VRITKSGRTRDAALVTRPDQIGKR